MKTNTIKNSKSELLSRPEPLSRRSLPKINLAARRANRSLAIDKLLALLRNDAPGFFEVAQVVGKLVWIQFTAKQPNKVTRILSEFGFHWNRTRQAWQHPCGTMAFDRSPYDPRQRYGSYFPADYCQ